MHAGRVFFFLSFSGHVFNEITRGNCLGEALIETKERHFFPCIFRYKLFNIGALNNITNAKGGDEKFGNHYRLCSFRCTAFNQAPLSRQLTGRSMQLKAIVTSVRMRGRQRDWELMFLH